MGIFKFIWSTSSPVKVVLVCFVGIVLRTGLNVYDLKIVRPFKGSYHFLPEGLLVMPGRQFFWPPPLPTRENSGPPPLTPWKKRTGPPALTTPKNSGPPKQMPPLPVKNDSSLRIQVGCTHARTKNHLNRFYEKTGLLAPQGKALLWFNIWVLRLYTTKTFVVHHVWTYVHSDQLRGLHENKMMAESS